MVTVGNAESRLTFYVRAVWIMVAVGILAADLGAWRLASQSGFLLPPIGGDFTLYRDAGARFLSGEGFYSAHQLAGPYSVWDSAGNILYPPVAIPLFAAFSVLPGFLWWAVPLGLTAWAVAWHRPGPLALLVILGLALWPSTVVNVIYSGNPSMWAVAALAVATTGRSWATPFVLLKPTLGPFALWGIRSRAWWVGLLIFALVSLAFLPVWADYIVTLTNARNAGWTYQLWHLPAMLIPITAYLGSGHGASLSAPSVRRRFAGRVRPALAR